MYKEEEVIKLIDDYLVSSVAYYLDYEDTHLTDHEFDMICRNLCDNYEDIPDDLKRFVNEDDLLAGTGFMVTRKDLEEWMRYIDARN